MANKKSIQILRGTNANIASSSDTLLPGQPLYNIDKNYLTIGGGGTSGTENVPMNSKPIACRELVGYVGDIDVSDNSYSVSNDSTNIAYRFYGLSNSAYVEAFGDNPQLTLKTVSNTSANINCNVALNPLGINLSVGAASNSSSISIKTNTMIGATVGVHVNSNGVINMNATDALNATAPNINMVASNRLYIAGNMGYIASPTLAGGGAMEIHGNNVLIINTGLGSGLTLSGGVSLTSSGSSISITSTNSSINLSSNTGTTISGTAGLNVRSKITIYNNVTSGQYPNLTITPDSIETYGGGGGGYRSFEFPLSSGRLLNSLYVINLFKSSLIQCNFISPIGFDTTTEMFAYYANHPLAFLDGMYYDGDNAYPIIQTYVSNSSGEDLFNVRYLRAISSIGVLVSFTSANIDMNISVLGAY